MRVAIVAPEPAAGTVGGAERAWLGLRDAIERLTPHAAELVRLPVEELHLLDLIDGYRRFAGLDVSRFDLVVTSKYPAWMVSHPNHVVYLFHPLRGLYDTYHLTGLPERAEPREPTLRRLVDLARRPPGRSNLDEMFAAVDDAAAALGRDHPAWAVPGPLAREVVHHLDAVALDPAGVRRHLALSRTLAGRAGYFPPTVTPEVVALPSDLRPTPGPSAPPQARRAAGLFTASRLEGAKRVDLVVRAMSHVTADVHLTVAGTGPDAEELAALAGDDPRIEMVGGVDDDELAARYAGALAVPFVPADEDYGLITLEAMAGGTPVVTTTDAGGPTELVVNGVNGLVTSPTPAALAQAIDRLAAAPDWATALGTAARRSAAGVTWEATVASVLAEPVGQGAGPAGGTRKRRPKVVVTSTYRVWPPRSGGQLRYRHLYGALAAHAEVEIVSLVNPPRPTATIEIAPGLNETVVGVSDAQLAEDVRLSIATGVPTTDIVAGRSVTDTPAYLAALDRALAGADAAILSHPFLLPAIELVDRGRGRRPFVYDAHNAETDLKEAVLSGTPAGRELAAWVADVEGRAVSGASHVTACSVEDAAALGRRFGRSAAGFVVVPNGTETHRLVPTPAQRRARSKAWTAAWTRSTGHHRGVTPRALALFLASWHPPNLDAAEVIIEVASEVPEVAFVLVGSHSDHYQDRHLPPNVVLAGVIDDTAKATLLASADVALNPIRTGSGTNLKVAEYFASGVPVVSTPFGVRGTDADHRHLLLADLEQGSASFASAVREVLRDPPAAVERAGAARALAVERFDWQALGDRLAEVVLAPS